MDPTPALTSTSPVNLHMMTGSKSFRPQHGTERTTTLISKKAMPCTSLYPVADAFDDSTLGSNTSLLSGHPIVHSIGLGVYQPSALTDGGTVLVICCQCGWGPRVSAVAPACTNVDCGHETCSNCDVVES
jgi:hypothetical protein